jgi:hypothetical protein
MFTTASMDATLRLWDANYLDKEAVLFELGYPINSHAFGGNCMIAVATTGHHVRLCDMRTGGKLVYFYSKGSSHALKGHRAAVYDVAWNPTSEYQIASCGADGCVKVFDIRKSTCLYSCNTEAWGIEYGEMGIVVVQKNGVGIKRLDLKGDSLFYPGRGGAGQFCGVVKPVIDEGYIIWPEGKYVNVWRPRDAKTRCTRLEGHYREVKTVGVRSGVGWRDVELYSGGKDHTILKWKGSVDKVFAPIEVEEDWD